MHENMTKYPGSKCIPHDSCSYFCATEYLLGVEFTLVDQYVLKRGKDLKGTFGRQTHWSKNKMECILYFSKELDFLLVREMFCFASAATICRYEELLNMFYLLETLQDILPKKQHVEHITLTSLNVLPQ